MGLKQILQGLESRLVRWLGDEESAPTEPQSPQKPSSLREEIRASRQKRDQLQARLKERKADLDRLTEIVALFPTQIEASMVRGKQSQAMRQSYELERFRRELEECRDDMGRLEQAIWSLEFHLRRLQRQGKRPSHGTSAS
ncbi:MAG: hypothetical protein U0840_07315 [Gemmataceae bacterium]